MLNEKRKNSPPLSLFYKGQVRRGWYGFWIEKVGRGGPPRPLVATGVRKKLNRESRERPRKEDEEFEQKKTVVGRGMTISSGSHFVIPVPFVVKKQSNQTTESTKDTKMKISENFVISVPFVVKKITSSTATPIVFKILSPPAWRRNCRVTIVELCF
jgi:hypothetical protein